MPESTGIQVIHFGTDTLSNPLGPNTATYKKMRLHPTIALTRALVTAPVVAGQWSIEADDDVEDDRIEFIRDQFLPIRELVIESAMLAGIDYGWAPYEKVFELRDGRIVLVKLKPLLHDITEIKIDQKTGTFQGFCQTFPNRTILPLENSLNIPFRVEGTQWYGQALLENARDAYNRWKDASAGAERYDKKIAGTHPVVWYPEGKSEVNGVTQDNSETAKDLLCALVASQGFTLPQHKPNDDLGDNDHLNWEIDMLSDTSPKQHSFIERLQYLDTQMIRALLTPERSITEGRFGTKAEASVHADLALTNLDLQHRHITRHINWHVVDQILGLNYGNEARGTIRLVAAPLANETLAFLRTVYEKVLGNVSGFLEEFGNIDLDAIKDALGIPKVLQVDVERRGLRVPLAGVDADDPLAATVRGIFASRNNGD